MSTYKYIILCIIFSMLLPCKIISGQDIESDTAVQSELDIKYDSVLAKATSSLTASAFQESINYYREASALKPHETYPYKMIRYVKDLTARQKLSDDLKRKAKIKDNLIRANQAIVDRSWYNAKSLFNEVLTLHPEKTDEDYAKSKIDAIDLELQRIALRIPVKEEPKPVIVPKNRREARAQRKVAERNAVIALASNRAMAQKQIASSAPLDSIKNDKKSISALPKEILQQSTEASLPDRKAAVSTPLPKEIVQKPTEASLPDRKVAVSTPLPKETSQEPTEASLPDRKVPLNTPLPKETSQKPAEASLPDRKVPLSTPLRKETSRKPTEALLPDRKVAVSTPLPKEISQEPTEASLPDRKVPLSTPLRKETSRKPTEVLLPNRKVAVSTPLPKEISQEPTEASLPDRKVPLSTPLPKETSRKPTEALLPDRKVAVVTPSPKGISQKQAEAPFAEKKADILVPPTERVEQKSIGVPLLNLADSSNYVKLICQDISFIGTNAYVKMLVQNYSLSESFLTDTLRVSIKKNNGSVKKLDQRFISNFPVVLPQEELVLVYFADASIAVDPDDIFILQMEDKLKQTKLMIQVPWSVYKQHKAF